MSQLNQSTKKVCRGFMVTIADNEQEAEAMKIGESKKFNLSPILAVNEQAALEHIQKIGKICLSIVSLELLEMQANLIYKLAESSNVEIIKEDLFELKPV